MLLNGIWDCHVVWNMETVVVWKVMSCSEKGTSIWKEHATFNFSVEEMYEVLLL
jgi:hypothetical protein